MRAVITAVLGFFLLLAVPSYAATDSTPADPLASQATKDLLAKFANLPNQADHRLMSGQWGEWSGFNATALSRIDLIYQLSGQRPGLISLPAWKNGEPVVLSFGNGMQNILDYHAAGGIIECHSPIPNPFFADKTWSYLVITGNFSDVYTDNGNATNLRMKAYLDALAVPLQTLEDANVPVLMNLLGESNAGFFWYGANGSNAEFKLLYQYVFNYLVTTKGLHNLLFVYATWYQSSSSTEWQGKYPGDAYVDIIGVDAYDYTDEASQSYSNGKHWFYDSMIAQGKPFALTEFGLQRYENDPPKDLLQAVTRIKTTMPETVFFLAWNDHWELAGLNVPNGQINLSAALNDPWVLNRDTSPPPPPPPLQATLTWNANTESDLAGYNIRRCTLAPCTPTSSLATVSAPATSYPDTSILVGQSYSYSINAFDTTGNQSSYTAPVDFSLLSTVKETLFTDTFNRADNADLGAAYTDAYTSRTTGKIVSQRVLPVTIATNTAEQYTGVTTPNDQWCEVTIGTLTGAQLSQIGCWVRLANSPTLSGYEAFARINTANTTGLRRFDAGTSNTLGTDNGAVSWLAGDKLRMEIQGTAIKVFHIRGTTETNLNTATDATYASGTTGIHLLVPASGALTDAQISRFSMGGFTSSSPISVDAYSTSANGNTTNSIAWAHTVGTGTNRELLVCAQARDSVAGDTAVTGVSSSLSGALTKIRDDLHSDAGTHFRTELWHKSAPVSGADTLTITWAAALSNYGVGSAISLNNVDQSAPIDAQAGNQGIGTAISSVISTVANNALVADCVVAQANPLTVGAGQTARSNRDTTGTVDSTGLSTVDQKAVAGPETMDWTQSASQSWAQSVVSFKPAIVAVTPAPRIASATVDATGANLTYGQTTPTTIRILDDRGSIVRPISAFPAGRFTWDSVIDGLTFKQFFARDSIGVENTNPADAPRVSLVGIAPPLDTNPVILSNPQPTTTQPAGTTSAVASVTLDKAAECRIDTVDRFYALMDTTTTAKQMTLAGLVASATITGLTNGSSTTLYVRCNFINTINDIYPNPTSTIITILVASPTDATPPIRSGGSPNGVLPSGTTSVSMQLTTNENATCKYGTSAGVAYGSLPNTFATTGTTAHSQTIAVSDGNTYTFYVKCQDGIPNANTDDFVITWSVTATPAPPDTTPPVRSSGAPSGTLSAGTTNVNITLTTDENATCKYSSVPGRLYSSPLLATFTTTGGTSHSVNISPLQDNSTYTYYVLCSDTAGNANTTDFVVTWFVAIAAGDTTAPSTVVDLVCAPRSTSEGDCNWTVATDNVAVLRYRLSLSTGACSTYTLAAIIPHPTVTALLPSLSPNTAYCAVVRAEDTSSNLSAADSNVATFTTLPTIDTSPPSDMRNLRLLLTPFTQSVLLTWDQGFDDSGTVIAIIEKCSDETCTNFTTVGAQVSLNYLSVGLTPNTPNWFRGKFSDGTNTSGYSNILAVTTATSGLSQPRLDLPFGFARLPSGFARLPRL